MDSRFVEQVHSSDINWMDAMFQKFLKRELTDPSWEAFFQGFQMGVEGGTSKEASFKEKQALYIAMIYRLYGYLQGKVSPFGCEEPSPLILEKLQNIDLDAPVASLGLLKKTEVSAREFIRVLEHRYCGYLVVETASCHPELQEYVWGLMEQEPLKPSPDLLQHCYQELCQATYFEEFLQVKFTGQKCFSLEGAESLVILLNHVVRYGMGKQMKSFILGMSHRGRLNVLSHVLGKSYAEIFMEFEDRPEHRGINQVGDVKYHKGYVRNLGKALIAMLPNPSHLEAVDPLVEGITAAMQRQGQAGEERLHLPILIHGDASFTGQGIVYEIAQLSSLPGYTTEGTLHIIINNQGGATTPKESRSTPYCTDIAKMSGIPVFRVNSEHISAVLRTAEHALEVRKHFGCDVMIDFCCYRKHGYNESDDPSITLPLTYAQIARKKPIVELVKRSLLEDGICSEIDIQAIEDRVRKKLRNDFETLEEATYPEEECMHCKRMAEGELLSVNVDVSLDTKTVSHIISRLCGVPEHFSLHPKVKALLTKRMSMARGDTGVDWGLAEEVALASLLIERFSIRLSGQDVVRGTFGQRHWLWSDTKTGESYSPLYHLSPDQGRVEIYNSPLSELAVVGFEYGYAQKAERTLVAWEAQFGDFMNRAQVIFDQYISSAIQKWDFHSDLILLLPHGYEGQGPEHSSARIERILQLASNWNFQVVIPSTPVQYFRILREHTQRDLSLPLVILTPKMLLNHPHCVSSLEEFSVSGGFRTLLEDEDPNTEATVLVFCSGKIYYDYKAQLPENIRHRFACIRIESLYPLHLEALIAVIHRYPYVREYVWLQEEPQNMGAYTYFFMATQEIFPKKLRCVSRPSSSSTATGSAYLSRKELLACMEALFSLGEHYDRG